LVAKLSGIGFADSALLFKTERPYLIALYEIAFQAAHLFIKQSGAALTSKDEQPENRVSMNLRHTFNTADARALDQEFQNHGRLIERDAHFVQRLLAIFCEGFAALGAAEALKAVTMLTKAIAVYLAVVARHCGMSLSSTTVCRIMNLRVSLRLRLRWIQALISVSALIGAFLLLANPITAACSLQGKNKIACKTTSASCIVSNMADGGENKNRAASDLGKLGGQKTAERGPEYYAEIQAKRQRRAGGRPKNPPKAAFEGKLAIGKVKIDCAVLEDGTRLLTQTDFMQALGRAPRVMGLRDREAFEQVPPILRGKSLQPFISEELLSASAPIKFQTLKGNLASGYKAEILPQVCDVFLKARESGELPTNQQHIARQSEVLVRGLAQLGIIALVDEATGYQYARARFALEEILEKFIEFRKWAKTFPDDFYREMFRLRGWEFKEATVKRTPLIGKLTLDLVYDRLAPGVRQRLEEVNPRNEKGYRKHKLFQRLTEDVGDPALRAHLASVITLMKVNDNWDSFMKMMHRALPKYRALPLFDPKPDETQVIS
jgi:hypothetical protein